jgi:hypothetical protein
MLFLTTSMFNNFKSVLANLQENVRVIKLDLIVVLDNINDFKRSVLTRLEEIDCRLDQRCENCYFTNKFEEIMRNK